MKFLDIDALVGEICNEVETLADLPIRELRLRHPDACQYTTSANLAASMGETRGQIIARILLDQFEDEKDGGE